MPGRRGLPRSQRRVNLSKRLEGDSRLPMPSEGIRGLVLALHLWNWNRPGLPYAVRFPMRLLLGRSRASEARAVAARSPAFRCAELFPGYTGQVPSSPLEAHGSEAAKVTSKGHPLLL